MTKVKHAAMHKAEGEWSGVAYARKKTLKGRPISPGIGYGRPCFFQEKIPELPATTGAREAQQEMIAGAFHQLSEQLGFLAESARSLFDHNMAEIFNAHRMIIECEELQANVLDTFKHGKLSAEDTIEKCFNDYFDYPTA